MIESKRLLVIAEDLVSRTRRGPPPQTSLRRAISTAYYALFHHIVANAADALVGRKYRRTPRYALIYRAFEHTKMRHTLELIDREHLGDKARTALGRGVPTQDMRDIATAFASLQKQRHWADYDPRGKVSRSDTRDLIEQAEIAMEALDRMPPEFRKDLLVFLMTGSR
jgi:uncharacterized protein (UPF0332 family)